MPICADSGMCYNELTQIGGVDMPVSKAQQKAVNKYMTANYDRINLTVPKGRKEEIQAFAASQGESTNAFINRAITEAMDEKNRVV